VAPVSFLAPFAGGMKRFSSIVLKDFVLAKLARFLAKRVETKI